MKQRFQSIAHHAKMSFSIGNVLFFIAWHGMAWEVSLFDLTLPCHIVKRKRDVASCRIMSHHVASCHVICCHIVKRKRDVASKLLSREDEIDERDERNEIK